MLVTAALSVLAVAATAGAANVVVPPPSGPYSVKTEVHDLTDESRWDPYANPNATHKRRILASTFLPIESCDEEVVEPYLPPVTEAAYFQFMASFGIPTELLEGYGVSYCAAGTGPEQPDGLPLVILSPGLTVTRLAYSVQARALASLGYAVVSIDHPYDALVVEFPDGTIVTGPTVGEGPDDSIRAVDVRVADISFLLDQLADLQFPIDFSRVLAVGHSLGGWTSAAAALADDRILGGINFDGRIDGPVVESGLSKPFILTGAPAVIEESGGQEGWRDFYDNSDDAKMILAINGTVHASFTDMLYMLYLKEIPAEVLPIVRAALGTVDGELFADIQRELVVALAELAFAGDATALKEIDDKFEEVFVSEEHFPGSC